MGLTFQSTKIGALIDTFHIDKKEGQYVIALAGNPNTGKSTVFNSLTGLHQHTGNWPGKTVVNARGEFTYNNIENILIDLPGTYSLFPASAEEEVARNFLCFGNPDAIVVVADATCLERNLSLVYQVMELSDRVILCINLIDEAKKKKIFIDQQAIEKELGIPVILSSARNGIGVDDLKEAIYKVTTKKLNPSAKVALYGDLLEEQVKNIQQFIEDGASFVKSRWLALRALDGDDLIKQILFDQLDENVQKEIQSHMQLNKLKEELPPIRDHIIEHIYKRAEEIKKMCVSEDSKSTNRDRKIDNIITSRLFGIPIMLLSLALVFWITISGANVPSAMIADFLFGVEDKLTQLFAYLNAPDWLHGVLILGLFRTLAWVVSVMLPPMAIFFPLFTILEDLGFLPRVAFNMDHMFKKACTHGKQCLTMCMGFGCNAAGIIACRIIDSPRERLIATLTNNFVPCNGRFPTLIAISSIFLVFGGTSKFGIIPALSVTVLIIIGIMTTLLVSYLLSKTLLKGIPSTFTLELPPYRVPKIGRVIYTSVIDRTLFVLWRAVIIAAPAGAAIWILGNIYINDISIIGHVAGFFDPFANLIGLDGFILMAFILGLPANEIVLPILMMCYLSSGSMLEYDSLDSLKNLLVDNGWTHLTALNTMLFSLLHWPCATTLLTIRKETKSIKWTLLAFAIPTGIAIAVCFLTTSVFRLLGLD